MLNMNVLPVTMNKFASIDVRIPTEKIFGVGDKQGLGDLKCLDRSDRMVKNVDTLVINFCKSFLDIYSINRI